MNLGIDIGNYNVKTSEGVIFKSAVSENIEYGNKFDKIEIDNKTYYLGTGRLEIDYRKFDKENYIPLLLGAICKSSNSIENKIGLGLPIKQYKAVKDELISKLINKTYDVTFNDIRRRIRITDVQVFPESVAGIIAHFNSTLFDVKHKICKSSNSIENKIGLGLPIKQYKAVKDELISKLINKTYDVTFNDIRRRIRITDVQVFPESVAGIIAHFNSTLFDVKHKDIVSVDIGGKTTDIALIRNKKVIQSSQVNTGTIDIYNCIKNSLEAKYFDVKVSLDDVEEYVIQSSQVNTGTIDIYNCIKNSLEAKYFDVKVSLDDVEEYLKRGFYYKGERQNINFAIKSCNDLFKEIYTELNLNYPINASAVVFQGGGMDLLNSVLSKKISNIIKIDDLFANARGYKSLLK